jgi:hypothetical protein
MKHKFLSEFFTRRGLPDLIVNYLTLNTLTFNIKEVQL